jgi:hypothetical protein
VSTSIRTKFFLSHISSLIGLLLVSEESKLAHGKMKKDKIIYWITTGIVCSIMTFSAINFSFDHPLAPGGSSFAHLGLPNYLKIELTVAKILGVVALLLPGIPSKIKEFAYFGFTITLISASVAHFSSGDGVMFIADPLIFLGVLTVSYSFFHKLKRNRRAAETGVLPLAHNELAPGQDAI